MESSHATEPDSSLSLTIRLEDLPDDVIERWIPKIDDPGLRKAMLRNPRLEARILDGILSQYELDGVQVFETPHEKTCINWILRNNLVDFKEFLGCAWLSNILARDAVAGKLKSEFPNLSQSLIRFALQFRQFASQNPCELRDVETQGTACLNAWLTSLTPQLGKFVFLKLGLTPEKNEDPERAALTWEVLSALTDLS